MFLRQDSSKSIIKMIKKGFTLVEVVVAIGVLTIGVLGVSGFFAYSSKISRSSSNTSIASNLTSGLIDEEIAKSYEELAPGNGAKVKISTDPANPFYNFSKQINISLIDSNLAASATDLGLKKIDVIVSYQEGSSEKNVQMSTIKTRR